jgi:hypothetical protein
MEKTRGSYMRNFLLFISFFNYNQNRSSLPNIFSTKYLYVVNGFEVKKDLLR